MADDVALAAFHRVMKPFRFLALALLALLLSVQALAGPKEDIQAAMQAQDWARADELLQTSLASHPKNALAHYWRAQVQAKMGRMQVAADELAAAKRIDPEHKFASNAQSLAGLEAAIRKGTTNEAKAAPAVEAAPAVVPQIQEQIQAPEPAEPKPAKRSPFAVLAVVIVAVVGLLIFLSGAAKRRARKQELEQCRTALQDAKQVLEDARLWSDGNAALSPEQKLGNYDRVNKLKGEISTLAAQIQSQPSMAAVMALVARAEDEAADIRGLEKPSVVRARAAEAAKQRQFDLDMERARNAPASSVGGNVGGIDPLSTLVVASMLSNASHANAGVSHASSASGDGYDSTPLHIPSFDDKPSFGIDIGGSSMGDTSFDSGGSSGGGDTSF
jgi:tetratricopeptide (TPR) repeat protein